MKLLYHSFVNTYKAKQLKFLGFIDFHRRQNFVISLIERPTVNIENKPVF